MKTLTDITSYEDFVKLIAGKVGLELGPETSKSAPVASAFGTAYWWLNANPKIWDFRTAPVGSVQTYTSHNEAGNKRQKFKYFSAVKPGDILIGYITSPDKEIVAVCEITKALHGPSRRTRKLSFGRSNNLPNRLRGMSCRRYRRSRTANRS